MEIRQIPLSLVCPSPMNPRKTFGEEELKELADNIEKQGLLQPITVRPIQDPTKFPASNGVAPQYEIICGERRYRAFVKLSDEWADMDCIAPKGETYNRFSVISAIVREMTDEEAFDAMISENLQRKDVDPMEEAFAFGQLVKNGKTVEEVAARFGKSIRFVQDRIKLNALIPELMKEVKEDKMPISAAMVICKVSADKQRAYYKQYVDGPIGFTTASAQSFVKAMFLSVDDAVWKDFPEFADGCDKACAQCQYNTVNHGCLFYEMNAKVGQCTNPQHYQAKTVAFIEKFLTENSDSFVKAGDPLEKGKTVIAINIDGYAPESVKKLKIAIRDRVKALGYEIVTPEMHFGSRCYYPYDDDRTQAMLESGECYRVLQLADYNIIHPQRQAWYLKKGDTETNVDGNGNPLKVQRLLDGYKHKTDSLATDLQRECAKAMSKHNALTDAPLTDKERKLFMILVAKECYNLRSALGIGCSNIRKNRDDDYEYFAEHPEKFDMCARAWMQYNISLLNQSALYQAEPMLDEIGAQWCPDEYRKTKDRVQASYDKSVAKIEEELKELGYTLDGEKIETEAPATETTPAKRPISIEKQFKEMKKKHPDALLIFRVNDFYEIYDEDAEKAAKILNLTITKRGKKMLCGFPYHALDSYLPKIIHAGHRVAICEQLDDPKR